ncbi:MAG TPA: TlpA disulfide reductase family protein [Ohtaekwangia sp.]|uniref:TlpA family protein disulfide reductase n=1 Tax=Ohtaekwangia sp. TaxID=2066019 RepID=UPI002F92E12E
MKKFLTSPRIWSVIRTIRPWVTMIAVIAILRYTGLLAGISVVAQSALMKTGVLDASPAPPAVARDFDYDFSVKDLNNNTIDFKQFKGKTIFLNLWATWCGPCRAEMPSIQQLYEQIDHEKVVFVMLSLDRAEDTEKVSRYIKDKGHTFPVYMPSGYLPEQLNVPSIPTTFVISPQGKIVSKKAGTANYNTSGFKEFLEKM